MKTKKTSALVMIFISGGLTLSLEVIASRIMTPYFGVSLYIWSGILSITLLGLAIGYYFGGKVSVGKSKENLWFYFLFPPAVTPLLICYSRFFYPYIFADLAQINLLLGSFIACTLFLFPELILLSAMNSLLIALNREQNPEGDGGAGKVFFISTVGSVAGVLFTAFVVIPIFPNSVGILVLGFLMGLSSLVIALINKLENQKHFIFIIASSVLGIIVCSYGIYSGLQPKEYLFDNNLKVKVVADYPGYFNTLKVIDVEDDKVSQRILLQDGLNQGMIDLKTGESLVAYSYALTRIPFKVNPSAKSYLTLGLGPGKIPMEMKEKGLISDAVEINPQAVMAAKDYFDFSSEGIGLYVDDARTFVKKCPQKYDIIALDLFQGDSTPDYLITREFFSAVKNCLSDEGLVALNSFQSNKRPEAMGYFLATLKSVFADVLVFPTSTKEGFDGHNVFMLVGQTQLPDDIFVDFSDLPKETRNDMVSAMNNYYRVTEEHTKKYKPATDDYNPGSSAFTKAMIDLRHQFVRIYPRELLVN